jgi:hypothetical protein
MEHLASRVAQCEGNERLGLVVDPVPVIHEVLGSLLRIAAAARVYADQFAMGNRCGDAHAALLEAVYEEFGNGG